MTTSSTKVLVPPINFALVAPGIYRSGHPNRKNLPFLRTLGLKSLMYVEGDGEYRKDSANFVRHEGIKMFTFDLSDEAEYFTRSGTAEIHRALSILLNTQNHPILVHDDMGKSVSTLLVSLIRRMQGWSLTGIYAEGDMFAGSAGGAEGGEVGGAGREFIALFKPEEIKLEERDKPHWIRSAHLST